MRIVKADTKKSSKLVLFGFVQLGKFKKGNSVVILDEGERREATILEAYVCKTIWM